MAPGGRKRMEESVSYPRTQRIGIFVFDGFEPIDVFGFAEAFTIARFLGTDYAIVPPSPFEVVLIGVEVEKVKSSTDRRSFRIWGLPKRSRNGWTF
jgi:hypothetical protein